MRDPAVRADAGGSAASARPAGRLGLASRLRRRLARLVLGPDVALLEGLAERLECVRAEVESRLTDADRSLEVLARDLRQEDSSLRQHLETLLEGLRAHADTRTDQLVAEVAGVRSAQVASHRDFGAAERRLASQDELVAASLAALQSELERLRDARVPRVEGGLAGLQAAIDALQAELEGVRDERLGQAERGLGALRDGLAELQEGFESVRDAHLPQLELGFENLHRAHLAVQALAEELRDRRLPVLSGRVDALVGALHEELSATASLVDRLIAGEPLRVEGIPVDEAGVPDAILKASMEFSEAFRGDRAEVRDRAAEYVPLLRDFSPILDVGCGRGELLEVLRDHGVAARGVDSDRAMVETCRRLGLAVEEGEALASLRNVPPGSLGAVTALHVAEHLGTAGWMQLLDLASRAVRPGGVVAIECPNPEALRVGANLFWVDPTHRIPVHPDAVAFVARAVGLRVVEVRRLRPFPAEQNLASPDQPVHVRALAERLDAWFSGPRDFLVIAEKPRA